jgi:hypothetical protein
MPALVVDRTDQTYGRLTVISRAAIQKSRTAEWIYRCQCGNFSVVRSTHLTSGDTQSCGCLQSEAVTTHGHTPRIDGKVTTSSTYTSWRSMKQRCNNPVHDSYQWYGGRGITYDPRWEDFTNFLADMSERPSKKHQLHRLDNDRPYTKSNCVWSVDHSETIERAA